MKCEKHNCEMVNVGRLGFGQVARPECPKCREEIEALRRKIRPSEQTPETSAPKRRGGW